MATPQSPAPQPGYQPPTAAPPAKKPTVWIVIAGLAALAAIGLGIWAFSVDSDLDAANEEIKQQQAKIAAADADERSAVEIEKAQIAEYQHTRRVLSRSKNTVAKQRVQIAKQREDVRAAQQQLDEAATREDKLMAQANLAQQRLDVAQACSRGTISAIDSVFSAPTAKAGVNRLTAELTSLSKDCNENIGT